MSVLTEKQQRRRKHERREKLARRKRAKIAGRQPLRDQKYLDFIRRMPCIICLLRSGGVPIHQETCTEAAHVGDRGLRQKCSDRETIPLCAWHHRLSPSSHHRLGRLFWVFHKITKAKLIAELHAKYEREKS
jgi:hypothetical protein